MRSLFLRIFVWFWVAIIAVVAVLVVFSPFLTQTRPRLARWEDHAKDWVMGRVERAAQIVHHHGLEGLKSGGERRHRGPGPGPGRLTPPRLLVFDARGNEVSGETPDDESRRLALQSLEQGQAVAQRFGGRHLSARPVIDPDGNQLVVVGTADRPPQLADLLEPRFLLPRLGALAAVAGLLVFWLAYYLSSPVGVLRSATRTLTAGDLGARAGTIVTRRRDEIGQLGRDFNAMAERIENLVGAQRQLLQDVSHELRSPLARLRVGLELARRKLEDHEHDRIELECERLEDLIGRLLEFTRLEGAALIEEQIDLAALLDEVVGDARFESGEDSITLDVDSQADFTVGGDRRLLRSAVDNVIRNAIGFTEKGSCVEVVLEKDSDTTVVSVSDRGPGIPDEVLERIFEPFFRVDEARDRHGGGTGLGLAIAARAIERHAGTIRALNRQGGGLTVEIRL